MKNLNDYKEVIPFTICGIPCQIGVLDYSHAEGSYSHNAQSDWDYYGYTDMDYEILDRKGYKAGWIEKKVTPHIKDLIEEAVCNHFDSLNEFI